MLSYKGSLDVKKMYIDRFAAHRAADEVIQGTGFNNGRGCFIGCKSHAERCGEAMTNTIQFQAKHRG